MDCYQTPLPVRFSRQEYWNGLPYPPLETLPDPGIELTSLVSASLAGGFFFTTSDTWNFMQADCRITQESVWYSPLVAICFFVNQL